MEALRDLADDFNVRDPRKLYRLARQRDLDVTQANGLRGAEGRRGPAGASATAPRALGKSAAEGPNDRLQADLIDFSQNTRGKTKYGLVVMDVFTREAAVEPLQNKNAETVGRATKRAARELTGDDGNFVVTTDLGNKFATLDRELPAEAVRRTKRPEDRNAIAVVDRGIQTLKKDLATSVASSNFATATYSETTNSLSVAYDGNRLILNDLELRQQFPNAADYPAAPPASPTKPFSVDHMLGPSFVSGGQQVFEFVRMMAHNEVYLLRPAGQRQQSAGQPGRRHPLQDHPEEERSGYHCGDGLRRRALHGPQGPGYPEAHALPPDRPGRQRRPASRVVFVVRVIS